MQLLHYVLILIISVVAFLVYMAVKYGNPYKLIMVFGKKGSGKTTLLVKLALQHKKKKWNVYSTCPVPGTYEMTYKDVGYTVFPPRSVLFIDEVGMIWDNRDFKKFDPAVRDWFKLQRQLKVKVYLFSQTFDVDKKIRDLCDSMYMCFCFSGWLSYAKEIRRKLQIVEPTATDEGRIADGIKISPFFMWIFGSRIVTYIPHWIPYFNTGYMAEGLNLKEREFVMTPDLQRKKRGLIARIKEFRGEMKEFDEAVDRYNEHQGEKK